MISLIIDRSIRGIAASAIRGLPYFDDRIIDHRDWKSLGFYLDYRTFTKVLRKYLGIDCRRRNNHLEFWPHFYDFLEKTQNKVDIEASFVRFVDDYDAVL